MKQNNLTIMLVFMLLSACGGGGDSGTGDTSIITTGRFLDSAVEGLNYQATTSGLSGVTNARGEFQYKTGMAYCSTDPVVFSVGRVEIGGVSTAWNHHGNYAGTSQRFEPSDFTPGALRVRTQNIGDVGWTSHMPTNIASFLMMLDEDGDPDNGITISQAVQADAANWPDVNFTTAVFSSQPALITIIDSLNSLSSGVPQPVSLPDSSAASAHLQITFRCAMGGGYSGTWQGIYDTSGSLSGNWYAGIDPITNAMLFLKSDPGTLILKLDFPIVTTAQGFEPYFSGQRIFGANSVFEWSGQVVLPSVFWAEFNDTRSGGNTGTGVIQGNKQEVTLSSGNSGTTYHGVLMDLANNDSFIAPYSIVIDGTAVTGNGSNLADNTSFTISGTVSGTAFNATTSVGHVITGQLTHNDRTLEASYSMGGLSGTFNACRVM